MVELVDYNELYNPNGKKAKKTTRRGKKKGTDAAPEVAETKAPETTEE